MKPIRVALVVAQHLFRCRLVDFLNSTPEIEVVAESCRGKEALYLAETYQPDIVLIDMQLPDIDGLTVIRQVVQNQPGIGILALSMFAQEKEVWAAIQAGAKGYLIKECSWPELLTGITSVAYRQIVFGAEIAKCVVRAAVGQMPLPACPGDNPMTRLTQRERQILALMGQGLSNCEIACRLQVKERTVEFHVGNILKKLGVASRVQAAILWAGRQDSSQL
jgi:DNA-binding NarL/FixJ family response regulator